MASKVVGIMLRHDDGDKEYYEPQFTEEDMKTIYKILDKYGDNNESKRGELGVVDISERIDKLFKVMRNEIGVMAEYGDNEDRLKEELSTCGEEILREYEGRYLKREVNDMRYEFLGIATTVKELDDLLRDNVIDEDAIVTAAGATCHVIMKYDENGKVTNIIFDDADYSDEWNEEEEM